MRKLIGSLWAVVWAVLLFAASVPANAAVSNLASWADLTGATWLVHLVATKGADHLVQGLSVLALVAASVIAGIAVIQSRQLKQDGRTINGLFFGLAKRDNTIARPRTPDKT